MHALRSERKHPIIQDTLNSEEAEIPEVEPLPRGRTAEERYGNFMIQQLNTQHRELLRDCAFNSRNILQGDDRDLDRELTHRDQVGSFGMVFMMENMVSQSHSSFMEIFAPAHQHHRLTLPMNSIMNYVFNSKGRRRELAHQSGQF